MKFRFLLIAALCACATPATAQQLGAVPAIVTDGAATVRDQQKGFGLWLLRMQRAFAIGQAAMESVGPSLQQMVAARGTPAAIAKARASIASARQALTESTAMLTALDVPDFPLLRLGREIQPAALRQSALGINANRLEMLAAASQVVTAIEKKDLAGMKAASTRMLAAGNRQIDMLILIAEARGAAVTEEAVDKTFFKLLEIDYRSQQRLVSLVTVAGVRNDPALPGDLDALADQIDTIVARSETLNEAEIKGLMAQIDGGAGDRAALERAWQVRVIARELFAQGRELATQLRAAATSARRTPMTIEALSQISAKLRAFEHVLVDIQNRITALLVEDSAT